MTTGSPRRRANAVPQIEATRLEISGPTMVRSRLTTSPSARPKKMNSKFCQVGFFGNQVSPETVVHSGCGLKAIVAIHNSG